MMTPNTTREALIVEALDEAAKLIRQVQALAPALNQSRQSLVDAHGSLSSQLTNFQGQVVALCDRAKVQVVAHIVAHREEAARQSKDVLSRAMADAARVAFGAELGAAIQRLRTLHERPPRRWETWLTHLAAAAVGSSLTLALVVRLWFR